MTSWGAVVVAGVLVPGVAVVRAVRAERAALIEDIGWGIPAGCLVAMVGWALGGRLAPRHPAESETFFLISGYPVLLVGAARGLVIGWERWGRRAVPVVVGLVLGAMATVVVAALAPSDPRAALFQEFGHPPTGAEMSSWRQAAHLLAPLGALTILVTVGALTGWWWARRDRDRRPTVAAACVAGLLGTGLLSTGLYLTSGAPTLSQAVAIDPTSVVVTRDEAELAAFTDPTPERLTALRAVGVRCWSPTAAARRPTPEHSTAWPSAGSPRAACRCGSCGTGRTECVCLGYQTVSSRTGSCERPGRVEMDPWL